MNRVRLTSLEVTNGQLPSAVLQFYPGLNVLAGQENRGKSYVFACLDFLFGAEDPPDPNRHSNGYERATLYFTLGDVQRGVVRREFLSGKSERLPYHPVAGDVPSEGWQKLSKMHSAKSESLSKYWLTAMGFGQELLRRNASGAVKNLTLRIVAHLALIDEIRILDKRSALRSTQVVAWPGDDDAFALVLNARLNPPEAEPTEDETDSIPTDVRDWIEAELASIDEEIARLLPELNDVEDEAALISRRADEFTASAETAASQLKAILEDINAAQHNLTEARSRGIASREIVTRLELLREYYLSDLRRLDAVNETAYLLEQLNAVSCPTCFQPFDSASLELSTVSSEYLKGVQRGTKAEARKINRIQADLELTIAEAKGEMRRADSTESGLMERLALLRKGAETQERFVTESHARMSKTFDQIGQLAHRKVLKERRRLLAARLSGGEGNLDPEEDQKGDKTSFSQPALDDFCGIVARLLGEWKWRYTPGPIEVSFDFKNMDIMVSGAAKRSFGKAVRAILNSAVLVGLMEYCFVKNLPHPGFVVLDSPLTTKKDKGSTGDVEEKIPDEMVHAFFEQLAANYRDCQVVVIDNKEPPDHIRQQIHLIRFDDDRLATRAGFFP